MSRLHGEAARLGPTWRSRALARAELRPTQRNEAAALRHFDRVLVSAESERRQLLALGGGDGATAAAVVTLPNVVDAAHFAAGGAAREPATLIFVGRMGYHANLAAARDLIHAIMPRLWARWPQARLLIVGADPPPLLRAWARRAGERVCVTGAVDDVRPYLTRATVAVSPLPYAVGIQNKILEAMATATPVVASPAAAAGLEAIGAGELLVADEPDAVAGAVLRLLDDPPLAARFGAAGRRYVSQRHDCADAGARLEAVYRAALDTCAGLRQAVAS
jgi:glycosyltransferase involved in cell wall biosynthesis